LSISDRLISIAEVSDLTHLPRSSIYELVRAPRVGRPFPAPIKLGPRRSRWRESAVLAWVNEREAAST
jgi:predicted DNA-binding transcriptional regulator AlpA